jgi:16S rRNA processing protein RimM
MENIFSYTNCQVERNGQWLPIVFAEGKRHGKGLVARIEGVDDRDEAASYSRCDIAIDQAQMPALEEGDFYWHQLEGLQVVIQTPEGERLLGEVDHLMDTGANDVLVVRKCAGSIDRRERLIPYVEQFVESVDLSAGKIFVDWDPEF